MLPDDKKPWTRFDEENLLHEINEDNRLRRLGIEPDEMDSLAIMTALKKKVADIKQEKLERRQRSASQTKSTDLNNSSL